MYRYALIIGIVASSVSGCVHAGKAKAQLTIPRNCITDVHLTDTTKCVYDEKLKVWRCSPISIDKVTGCEQVQVSK